MKYVLLCCYVSCIKNHMTVDGIFDSKEQASQQVGHSLNRYVWSGAIPTMLYKCIPLSEAEQVNCIGKSAAYINRTYGSIDNG